jgi:hypothetical protein
MISIAISRRGPLFLKFFDKGERLNAEKYCNMLEHEMLPQIRRVHPNGFIFQQDGAPCHTANHTQDFLRNQHNVTLISKAQWPAKSPDLNMCDYRTFAHLMQKVYTPTRPRMTTIDELKDRISLYFWELTPELCARWADEFRSRLQLVVDHQGGPIQNIVNKI